MDRVLRDFAALRLRATAYHVLQPGTPVGKAAAHALKQQIETETANGAFVLDVVRKIARDRSTDPDSAPRGGLLAEDFAPGTFRKGAEVLEGHCFTGEIGKPLGPIKTPFGYSVLLITERTGCRKDDPGFTRLSRSPDGRGRLGPSEGSTVDAWGLLVLALLVFALVLNLAGIVADIMLSPEGGWGILSRGGDESLFDSALQTYTDFTVRSWER